MTTSTYPTAHPRTAPTARTVMPTVDSTAHPAGTTPTPARTTRTHVRPARTPAVLNGKVVALELRRVVRNRRTIGFVIVFPIVMFVFIAAQIQGAEDRMGAALANVGSYVMVSMALYGAIMATTSGGASVSIERASGWSRQLRLTPLSPTAYIVAKVLAALVVGLIATTMTFAAGALTGRAHMPAEAWWQCGLVVIAGSMVFAAFGLFMGYLLPSENVMQYLGPILAILSIFGGIFSAPIAPDSGFGKIAQLTPIYGLGQIAHWPLSLTAAGTHAAFEKSWVLNVVIWGLVFLGGAIWRFRRDTARV